MTPRSTLSPLKIDLNLLEIFVLVADYRSFATAANRSGRSSSAVSRSIKGLEEQLGLPVFSRTTRSVELTEHGHVLYDAATKGLHDIRQGLLRLQQTQSPARKRVSIACSTSLSWRLLPPIFDKFRSRYRNVDLDVVEMSSSQMMPLLLDGDVAFGIGVLDHASSELKYECLVQDPIIALIPKSLPQSRLASISLAEFAALPLILPAEFSCTRRRVMSALGEAGVTARVKYDNIRFHTLIAMVEAGQGAAAFSALSTRDLADRSFSRVPIYGQKLFVEVGIITAKSRGLSKLETALCDLLRQEASDW